VKDGNRGARGGKTEFWLPGAAGARAPEDKHAGGLHKGQREAVPRGSEPHAAGEKRFAARSWPP